MSFLSQKINGLKMRSRSLKYGINYLRSSDFTIPQVLKINGRPQSLSFSERQSPEFIYEFREICIEDCYHLKQIAKQLGTIKTIVDVGANQGLFTLAARQFIPSASISCYEPNPQLRETLETNCRLLQAIFYEEAVTRKDCLVSLNIGESDLHTTTAVSGQGTVKGTGFAEVISRAGGSIDILKLDCEGAEWDLLEEKEQWKKVRAVTMEYHLWAKPGITVDALSENLISLGFKISFISALSESFGLLCAIREGE